MNHKLRVRLEDLQGAFAQYDKVILQAADDHQPFDELLLDVLENVRLKTEAAIDQLKPRGTRGGKPEKVCGAGEAPASPGEVPVDQEPV